VNASLEDYIEAIIVLTKSGETAGYVAKYRPQVPIITVTRSLHVARSIHLHRGCYPLHYDQPASENWQEDVDGRIQFAIKHGKAMGLLKGTGSVVAIQGWKGGAGNSNTLRILPID
jgi:pyruvate kinase